MCAAARGGRPRRCGPLSVHRRRRRRQRRFGWRGFQRLEAWTAWRGAGGGPRSRRSHRWWRRGRHGRHRTALHAGHWVPLPRVPVIHSSIACYFHHLRFCAERSLATAVAFYFGFSASGLQATALPALPLPRNLSPHVAVHPGAHFASLCGSVLATL